MVDPGLQSRMIGQYEIGVYTRVIQKAAEAYEVGNLLERLAHMQAGGKCKNGIGLIQHQDFRRMRPLEQDLFRELFHRRESTHGRRRFLGWAKSRLRSEYHSSRPAN